MKIRITRHQKIKLLKAVFTGTFESGIFPELHTSEPKGEAIASFGEDKFWDKSVLKDPLFRNTKYQP